MMFLVALRSFVRYVPIKGVHILNDGTVTAEDKALLFEHIPGLVFHELADFSSTACPAGGCWERLLGIATLVSDQYVIQLDSDTLAISAIDEVVECVRNNTSFTLGTWDGQKFETMAERAGQAKKLMSSMSNSHIQVLAEANLDKLSGYESLRYIRGCAGFAGFAMRSFSREKVEFLSQEMYTALGSKWNTWGSEQFASNVIVANSERAVVLPHPKYCSCNRVQPETSFIHFIGGCRFKHGIYARLGNRVISELKRSV